MLTHDPSDPLRARRALGAMFLANGFLIGTWAPQIPALVARHGIGEATLGLLILTFGLGALSAMPIAGFLIHRYGSRGVLRVSGVLASFALVPVILASQIIGAAAALFCLGMLVGAMEVAMNANAVIVERRLGRAIMSSSHGFWSVGGVLGGGLGGFAIERIGAELHVVLAAALTLALVVWAMRGLLEDASGDAVMRQAFRLPRSPAVYLLGLMAMMSMIPEGAVLDWAALYLRQDMGSSIAVAGLAYAGFSAAMAVMRFTGDGLRDRYGAVRILRISGAIAAVGMAMAAAAPSAELALVAFAICGLGVANMVPIAFSAAGNQSGMAAGASLSTVTMMGYSGILAAPSAIGVIAETTGFALVFAGLAVLLALVSVLAPLARSADRQQTR